MFSTITKHGLTQHTRIKTLHTSLSLKNPTQSNTQNKIKSTKFTNLQKSLPDQVDYGCIYELVKMNERNWDVLSIVTC